ncbi:hypothetical protein [uncultured Brevundimonas sp.]|uniref:hypothetical protein n=1 Tax=uncultured Brevundimonas sp. TaxID=213418 RepID=UPI00260FA542|nr:hypothetical protein [uncultured Brevundimonas sp.]
MSGSGTVLRQAAELGHIALGYDVDPLAVLMARVWTTPVDDACIGRMYNRLTALVQERDFVVPEWLTDAETSKFVSYWFGPPQATALTRLAAGITKLDQDDLLPTEVGALDVLKLNLSRIVVTKEQAASLARDTSHSRPHRTSLKSKYDVLSGYDRSLKTLRNRLLLAPPPGSTDVSLGDARRLISVGGASVDAVVTSPPYLNAIDYLRGHRLALVWLGWTISELRSIRSNSIGSERRPDAEVEDKALDSLVSSIVAADLLPARYLSMIRRYAVDLREMMREVARVLKPGGQATFVVGNSCLKGVFVKNAEGVASAAKLFGLTEVARAERELPQASRYLPVTGEALAKRMRTETVLTFAAG